MRAVTPAERGQTIRGEFRMNIMCAIRRGPTWFLGDRLKQTDRKIVHTAFPKVQLQDRGIEQAVEREGVRTKFAKVHAGCSIGELMLASLRFTARHAQPH
jgi:hypothetical protein